MGFAIPMVRKWLIYLPKPDRIVEITNHGLFFSLFDGDRHLDGIDTKIHLKEGHSKEYLEDVIILDQWDEVE